MKTLAFLEFILSDYSICVCRIFNKCVYIYMCVCVRVKKIYTIVYTQWCVYYIIYVRMEGLPIALIYNSKDPTSPLSTYLDLKRTSSHAEMRSRHFCAFQALGPLGRVILDDGHFGQKAMSGQWLLVAAKLPEKSLVHSWASPAGTNCHGPAPSLTLETCQQIHQNSGHEEQWEEEIQGNRQQKTSPATTITTLTATTTTRASCTTTQQY